MAKWWQKVLGVTPEVAVTPQAVSLNATSGVRAERNRQRMERLRLKIAQGDTRPELRAELERRQREGR